MQPRAFVAALIFLASYLPLSVILLIQDIDAAVVARPLCTHIVGCQLPLKHPAIAIGFVAVCTICLGFTVGALSLLKPKAQIKVEKAKHVPADLMNHALPYIVSFMGLDYGDSIGLLGFIVFFFWIFLITWRSGRVIMNPVLAVFGWRLYELEHKYVGGSNDTHVGMALSKMILEPGDLLRQQTLQDVMILKSKG